MTRKNYRTFLQIASEDAILGKEVQIMKKIMIYCMSGFLLVWMLAGCAVFGPQETISRESEDTDIQQMQQEAAKVNPMEELLKDHYGDYQEEGGEIAFVSDGTVMDGGYNEAIYKGIQMYGLAAGVSFSCYNIEEDNFEGHLEILEHAVSRQAKLIVCAGYDFQEAVGKLQDSYPEVFFLLIDGVPVDDKGSPADLNDNVHCVSFQEQESGYMAGYMAVLEGYRRFGFIGGKKDPAVIRYGYGYLQGIDDAAKELELEDVTVNYWYAETYQPSEKIYEKAVKWYEEGTEIIFACGGFLYESVLEAAEEKEGLLIGVDVDQCKISDRFLTSAVKDIANAVVISLDNYYAMGRKWSEEFAGECVRYGAEDNCTGIPILETEWRFQKVTMDKCYEVYAQIKQGKISVSDEILRRPQVSVTVKYVSAGG